MKLEITGNEVMVELTERNLEALLAKVRLPEGESSCMIYSRANPDYVLFVRAVKNEEHYGDRPAGRMHPREEIHLSRPDTGVRDYPL